MTCIVSRGALNSTHSLTFAVQRLRRLSISIELWGKETPHGYTSPIKATATDMRVTIFTCMHCVAFGSSTSDWFFRLIIGLQGCAGLMSCINDWPRRLVTPADYRCYSKALLTEYTPFAYRVAVIQLVTNPVVLQRIVYIGNNENGTLSERTPTVCFLLAISV